MCGVCISFWAGVLRFSSPTLASTCAAVLGGRLWPLLGTRGGRGPDVGKLQAAAAAFHRTRSTGWTSIHGLARARAAGRPRIFFFGGRGMDATGGLGPGPGRGLLAAPGTWPACSARWIGEGPRCPGAFFFAPSPETGQRAARRPGTDQAKRAGLGDAAKGPGRRCTRGEHASFRGSNLDASACPGTWGSAARGLLRAW